MSIENTMQHFRNQAFLQTLGLSLLVPPSIFADTLPGSSLFFLGHGDPLAHFFKSTTAGFADIIPQGRGAKTEAG